MYGSSYMKHAFGPKILNKNAYPPLPYRIGFSLQTKIYELLVNMEIHYYGFPPYRELVDMG